MENEKVDENRIRILGRQIGVALTDEEIGLVSGGPDGGLQLATDTHGGTCTNEQDYD